jgi:hypothetical protein
MLPYIYIYLQQTDLLFPDFQKEISSWCAFDLKFRNAEDLTWLPFRSKISSSWCASVWNELETLTVEGMRCYCILVYQAQPENFGLRNNILIDTYYVSLISKVRFLVKASKSTIKIRHVDILLQSCFPLRLLSWLKKQQEFVVLHKFRTWMNTHLYCDYTVW